MTKESEKSQKYVTENFCSRCDHVLNAVFEFDSFWKFKTGRVRCGECGEINSPCNECFGTNIQSSVGCNKCPWSDSEIAEDANVDDTVPTMAVPYKISDV